MNPTDMSDLNLLPESETKKWRLKAVNKEPITFTNSSVMVNPTGFL